MIFRKPRAHQTDDELPTETRAERRRRERDARRGIVPPKPVPEWRKRLEGGIWRLLRKGLYGVVILALVWAFDTVNEKISDPRIAFYGTVVDEYRQGIEGAAVEWSTSRDGGFGRLYSGTTFTGEGGGFYPGPKGMRGTSLTIHKVSKEGHQTIYKPRTYRYRKDRD